LLSAIVVIGWRGQHCGRQDRVKVELLTTAMVKLYLPLPGYKEVDILRRRVSGETVVVQVFESA
jgi:hypothetical protein